MSSSTPSEAREVAGRVALDCGQRVGVAGGGDDAVGPEGAYGGGEQERAVGAAAEGDQHGAELAQSLVERGEPQVEHVVVEPGRELVEAVEHDVGAGRRSSSSRVLPPVSTETLTTPAARAPSTSWTWSPT